MQILDMLQCVAPYNMLSYLHLFPGAGSGLVTAWEQQSGMLLASGDARIIRIWDAHREINVHVSLF